MANGSDKRGRDDGKPRTIREYFHAYPFFQKHPVLLLVLTLLVGGLGFATKYGPSIRVFWNERWKKAMVTDAEMTCLNEWVLKIAPADSQDMAEKHKSDFLARYTDRRFGHVNNFCRPIWEDNVHVVRDIDSEGKWIVVIDMYRGPSTEKCMEKGRDEMLRVVANKRQSDGEMEWRTWNDTIGSVLGNAEPLCYDMTTFEKTNGKIINTSPKLKVQRSYTCKRKVVPTRESDDCAGGYEPDVLAQASARCSSRE